ncbi:MAG: hypothetical protein AB1486_31870 [Planctomycetota bacterium]
MRHKLMILVAAATALMLSSSITEAKRSLNLVVDPGGPIQSGDRLVLTVSDGMPGDLAFLLISGESGAFVPGGPLGLIAWDGKLAMTQELGELPKGLAGASLRLQVVTVRPQIIRGGLTSHGGHNGDNDCDGGGEHDGDCDGHGDGDGHHDDGGHGDGDCDGGHGDGHHDDGDCGGHGDGDGHHDDGGHGDGDGHHDDGGHGDGDCDGGHGDGHHDDGDCGGHGDGDGHHDDGGHDDDDGHGDGGGHHGLGGDGFPPFPRFVRVSNVARIAFGG